MTDVRKGQAPATLDRAAFGRRFRQHFFDPAFDVESEAIARLDRDIGYYAPYATSHEALDRDEGVQEEARNVGRAVAHAVHALRAGRLAPVQPTLAKPRLK